MSDVAQGPGWWQASDGRWYPPESHPGVVVPPLPPSPAIPVMATQQPPETSSAAALSAEEAVAQGQLEPLGPGSSTQKNRAAKAAALVLALLLVGTAAVAIILNSHKNPASSSVSTTAIDPAPIFVSQLRHFAAVGTVTGDLSLYTDAEIIAVGNEACLDLTSGDSAPQTVEFLTIDNTAGQSFRFAWNDGAIFVRTAGATLCPQFQAEVSAVGISPATTTSTSTTTTVAPEDTFAADAVAQIPAIARAVSAGTVTTQWVSQLSDSICQQLQGNGQAGFVAAANNLVFHYSSENVSPVVNLGLTQTDADSLVTLAIQNVCPQDQSDIPK